MSAVSQWTQMKADAGAICVLGRNLQKKKDTSFMDLGYWKKEEVATRPSALGLSDPERTIFLGQEEHVSVWLTNMSVQLTNVSVRLYINVSTFICQWEGVTCYIVQWWQTQIWLPYKKYGQHTKSMITIPEVWSTHHKYGQNTRNMVNIREIRSTFSWNCEIQLKL